MIDDVLVERLVDLEDGRETAALTAVAMVMMRIKERENIGEKRLLVIYVRICK